MNNDQQRDRYAERQRLRESVVADIITQVHTNVDDLLARTPDEWPDAVTDAIAETVIGHTRLVLDSLEFEELQWDVARCDHIDAATADARRLINLRFAQEGRE